jgi:trehalose 6-phosphate phosphatase
VLLEDKDAIWSFHLRGAGDEAAARAALERVAETATSRGLVPHWGRKVLEIRPPLPFGKGASLADLLRDRKLAAALFAGDDATDLDAFRALRELREGGYLDHAVCVGVASDEGPPEITAEADLVVDGPDGARELLSLLL